MTKEQELQVRQWFDVFKNNSELVEIRAFVGGKTYSGYFDNIENLLENLKMYHNANIYYTINKIDNACASRLQYNKITLQTKNGNATSKKDIIFRKSLAIDIDVERPSGVASTDKEKAFAKVISAKVYQHLLDFGFERPVICDSSSGYHLIYSIRLENTSETEELIKKFLETLSLLFTSKSTEIVEGKPLMVKIDTVLHDANRILRLPGSFGRKGMNTAKRPHRMCKILNVPDDIKPTPKKLIEEFIKKNQIAEEPKTKYNNYGSNMDNFDLEAFLSKNNITVHRTVESAKYTKYVLSECPFDSNHKAPDSAIFKLSNGAIGFKCLHDSCSGKTWKDVRLKYEPNAYSNQHPHNNHRRFTPYSQEEKEVLKPQVKENKKGNVWQSLTEIEDEDRSNIVSIPSGILEYDNRCCGFDKPSFSVWSGSNGSGKSTLLNQLTLNAINKDFKVAVYSGELRAKRFKRWITYQAAGKNFNKKSKFNELDFYTPKMYTDRISQWTEGKLFNYNTLYSNDFEQIVLEIEKLVKSTPLDMLILDNLSALDLDSLSKSPLEQQKKAINRLVHLTNELEISLHLVVHPRKAISFLRKDDLSGAKTITDLADNVFIVHRWNTDTHKAAEMFMNPLKVSDIDASGASNIVEVVKHREFGQAEGDLYNLFFEPESRRFKNNQIENLIYGWQEDGEQLEMIKENFEESPNYGDWLTKGINGPGDEIPPF